MAKRRYEGYEDGMSKNGLYKGRSMRDAGLIEGYSGAGDDAKARRAEEKMYGGMLKADYNAIANMPPELIMRQYPMVRGYLPDGMLDDTIKGVDSQLDGDNRRKKQDLDPRKV